MVQPSPSSRSDRAAMFVDYENLYSVLTAQSAQNRQTGAYADEILDEVRRYLEEGDDTPTIVGRAFGPFDVLLNTEDADVPTSLHRQGIEPTYVPAAMQGNTSEIRLAIEVTQFLAERPDVTTIVIVTGDRPYLPLVRTIEEQGRRALVAAINPPQDESYAEYDLYLDARNLLSQDSREDLLANAPDSDSNSPPPDASFEGAPQRYEALEDPMAKRTIEITEEHFGQYDEVYLTPLLRKLSDVLGSEHDPKQLVSTLEAAGAVRLEKRNGYPYDYTVLIMNEDHPDVQSIQEGTGASAVSDEAPSVGDGSAHPAGETTDTDAADGYDYDEYAIDEAISDEMDAPDPQEAVSPADLSDGSRDESTE